MLRRALLSTCLLPASAGAAVDCPAEKLGPQGNTGAIFAACLDALASVLGRLDILADPGQQPGNNLEDEDGVKAAAEYDELREKVAALRAYAAAHPGDPFVSHQDFAGVKMYIEEYSRPRYKEIRDRYSPPAAVSQPDGKTTAEPPAGPPQPAVTPAPTPEKQDEAHRRAEKAEQGLPEQPAPAQAVRVASDYLRGADPRAAVRVLDRAGEDGGGDSALLNLRSAARYQSEDWAGAYADARRALDLDPEDERAAELAGAARMMLRRLGLKEPRLAPPKRAEEEGAVAGASGGAWGGGRALPAGTSDAAAKFWAAGQSKLRIGDRRGALLDLARVLERDPRHLLALIQRANLLNHGPKPDHGAALAEADKALAVAPEDPAALRERAYALVALSRFAEALAAAEAALRAEPGSALGHLYRAMALKGLGRAEEALAAFKRAAELDPTLREYYDEARGVARHEGGGDAVPSLATRGRLRLLPALLGLPLLLWGLWKGARLAAGWTRGGTTPPPAAAEPPDTLAPGTVLGGLYRVGGVLGRGGMGVVYEAEDLGLRRRVAVKELRADGAEHELLLREARVVAALRHPGILQIFALAEEGGRLYMVFERVDGRALDAELAERGRLSPEAVRDVLRDVCPALAHAHEARVIHRDLKPANVMRAAGGRCKVMDFGIAHEASRSAMATRTEPWGTPPYMAPEQEEGRVSRESDLYALACTAYELLAGDRPFAGMAGKLERRFRPLSAQGLPAALDGFMSRALDPDPARRFHTAEEFLRAFEGCLTDRIAA